MNNDATPTGTNGTATLPEGVTVIQKAPGAVENIRAEFEAAGGKVDKKKALAARDAYIKTNEAVARAEIALKQAQNVNQDAAKALMLATGAEPLKFGGTLYNPAGTRSGTVYYRPASTREVLDLDSK